MKPQINKPISKRSDFLTIGVNEDWIDIVMEIYVDTESLLSNKPTQVHQKLNGFRKKNKLNLDALQLDNVAEWFKTNS